MSILSRATLTVTILLTATNAHAQKWTLDRCINYAIEHNINVRISEADTRQAAINISQAKAGYLPNVSANAGQSWNLGRGLTAENTYADRNTSSFNWSASASLPIFDGLRTQRRIAYTKANLSQIVQLYEAAKEDVSINVISNYLQVLYTKELLEVAQNQVALSEYEISRRKALLEAGKIPEIELLEAQSILSSDQYNEVQAHNDHEMAKINLAHLLNLDEEAETFDVEPLTDKESIILKPETAFEEAMLYNHKIAASKKSVEANEANIKLSTAGYLPTLSFGTSIGSTYYRISGYPNENFGDQMRHNYSTYFGFTLNVPIYDASSTRNSIKMAKAQKMASELQLEQAENTLHNTIYEVYYQAVGAQKKYESSLTAEEYAKKAFEAMTDKYNLGKANSSEYEQSKTKSAQATAERIQANYELILRTKLLEYYTQPH